MCSLAEGGFVEEPSAGVSADGKLCQKCKVKPAVLTLRKKDVYCLDCFVVNCNHKFRSTLGKNKVMFKGDRVLMPFDGTANSLALLDLINNSQTNAPTQKKHFYTVTVLISDFVVGDINSPDLESRTQRVKNVIDLAVQYLPMATIRVGSFESGLSGDGREIRLLEVSESDFQYEMDAVVSQAPISDLLKEFSEASAKEEFVRTLEEKFIVKAAKQLGCNKVFQPDGAADLAITLMTGCSTGRGINLSDDTAFINGRHHIEAQSEGGAPEFQILRPMREFSNEEIDTYSSHVLQPAGKVPVAPVSCDDTIRGLTRKFLLGLQANFPATIPTIFRTTSKLEVASGDSEGSPEPRCPLCSGRNSDIVDSPSVEATQISRVMSSIAHFNKDGMAIDLSTDAIRNGNCLKENLCEIGIGPSSNIHHKACYSCRLILDRMKSTQSLTMHSD